LWDAVGQPADKDAQGKPIPAPRAIKYKMEDFTFLKVLGKGSFGKVEYILTITCPSQFFSWLDFRIKQPQC